MASTKGSTHARAEARRGTSHASEAEARRSTSSWRANLPPLEAPSGTGLGPSGPVRPRADALAMTSAVASGPRLGLRRSTGAGAGVAVGGVSPKRVSPCRGPTGGRAGVRNCGMMWGERDALWAGSAEPTDGDGKEQPWDHLAEDHRPVGTGGGWQWACARSRAHHAICQCPATMWGERELRLRQG